ncbi:Crp/Fnr family transcriptional regulator [Actinomadura namibiensis]|uniref:CRP-like cAMP-binding protein n=1 Tax=Actinomadura namibiensis TaxID=182080 RepID=A0A7W3LNF6_ACTNM|nr:MULTISPECIES: Crp/Fnr family transcriptional regulator [Actinomadura]MBA8951322.1 CRP-like cAMP-binding protein [Actinomadura namibiensis]
MTRSNSYWGKLGEREREALRKYAVRDILPAGDKIIRQRSRSHSALILLRGWAAVISEPELEPDAPPSESGNLLGFRGDGDIIGELAAISGGPRSATVRALDEVEVLEIDAADFKRYLLENPGAQWALLEVLVERLQEGSDFVRLKQHKISVQVPEILVMLADRVGREGSEGVWFPYPRRQEELANLLGVSRESVSATWTRLRNEGLVASKRNRLLLLDVEGLRALLPTS